MHILSSLLFVSAFIACFMFFRSTWVQSGERMVSALAGAAPLKTRFVRIEIIKGPVSRYDVAVLPLVHNAPMRAKAQQSVQPNKALQHPTRSAAPRPHTQDYALAA